MTTSDDTKPEQVTGSVRPEGPSEAQVGGNRGNAKLSTGPRTEEGRRRSASNSVKHGVFARSVEPIERGIFREDPDKVAEFVESVRADLEPKTAIEEQLCREIARGLLRLKRLGPPEAMALSAAGKLHPLYRRLCPDEGAAWWRYMGMRAAVR
jgi:hypothetical protein